MRAYKSLAEQSARCAGAAADAVTYKLEATSLRQRLELTENALASATAAAEASAKALDEVSAPRDGRGKREKADVYALEGRVSSLLISESSAISRAEAAERVLDDAMGARKELAERLAAVESPVAELTEKVRTLEAQLHDARASLDRHGLSASTHGHERGSIT